MHTLRRLLHSRIAIVVVSVLGTATITGGIAWAVQSPVSGGVVHGCYNPATGAVQLKVNSACPTSGNKTPINWNVTPGKGPVGATGPTGHEHVEIVTWNLHAIALAAGNPEFSATKFPAGSNVAGITGTLSGDFRNCTGSYNLFISIRGTAFELARFSGNSGIVVNQFPIDVQPVELSKSGGSRSIEVDSSCVDTLNHSLTMPAFNLSLTVQWTRPYPARNIT